jgi:hypothetical protein
MTDPSASASARKGKSLGRSSQKALGRPALLAQAHLAGFAAEDLLAGRRPRSFGREVGLALVARSDPELGAAFAGVDERDGYRAVHEMLTVEMLRTHEQIVREVERYYAIAHQSLAAVWPAVESVAKALLEQGELEGDRLDVAIHPDGFEIFARVYAVQRAHGVMGRGSGRRDCGAVLLPSAAMPLKRNPYVASPDQIRITRQGDYAVFEYADDTVATTQVSFGKEKLASMSDEQLLDWWNRGIEARDEHRESIDYVATEIPPGKPQVEFFELGDQWTPRGHVLRCEILHDTGMQVGLDEPFVSLDGRDFTLREFTTMIGTFGGCGMRVEFVPKDALR